VIRRWEALAHPRATPLSVSLPDGTQLDGAFDGLSADGALCLRLADGRIRAIHAGDVFLV
jgi:BirA family biotin operon repressor/biotin-[acetyl-CoA-carboxylase] ligase